MFILINTIISFLRSLKPELIVQAPSRINLINPLDAVEADFWMPSVAIHGVGNPLSTFVYIKKIEGQCKVKIFKINKEFDCYDIELEHEEQLVKDKNELKEFFNGNLKLIYGSIYRLLLMSSCFEEEFSNENLEIGIITTIPRQSGLGGSASLIVAIIFALANYFNYIITFLV